ncbi:MAG TPA: Hpt domain-containing protein, partial [bacterium]|nr:Hpt domain-containing protein [bacterium]
QNFQESVESIMSHYQESGEDPDEKTVATGGSSESENELPEYLEDPSLLKDFLVEAEEHLDKAKSLLKDLADQPDNRDILDAIYRPFHTIKDIAGFLALHDIEEIAHEYEQFLNQAREGDLTLTRQGVNLIPDAIHVIREIMGALRESLDTGTYIKHSAQVEAVLTAVRSYDPASASENEADEFQTLDDNQNAVDFLQPFNATDPMPEAEETASFDPVENDPPQDDPQKGDDESEDRLSSQEMEVNEVIETDEETDEPEETLSEPHQEEPDPAEGSPESSDTGEEAFDVSQDPELLQDFLQESEENLSSVEQNLLKWEKFPDDLEIVNDIFRPFHTIKGVAGFLNLPAIEKLSHEFETLLDQAREGEIRLRPDIANLILQGVDALRAMMETLRSGLETGDLNLRDGDITPLIEKIHAIQAGEDPEEGLTSDGSETNQLSEPQAPGDNGANREQPAIRNDHSQRQKSGSVVKVDVDKMDHLIDMVGELVIVQNMISQNPIIREAADKRLLADISQLKRIASTLQNISMSLRMVPIEATFRKMQRIVRDLAYKSGKKIELRLSGEQTEIDRNMVETLYDPLVHMVRNACDHGIETPEARAAAGKNPAGTIHLNAYHRGGNIVIEISDDGAGLDKESILKRARERNLVSGEDGLSDKHIYELLFRPGFSTAHQVTEVSGRGVGLDVGQSTIEQMRGQIDIETVPEQGTTFYIRLPLTLAIIDGVIIRVGFQRYVIPTLAIKESVQVSEKHCNLIAGRGETVTVRDHVFPLIRLHYLFNVERAVQDPWEGIIMVVDLGGESAGILVDELVDKQEVVIKSMGEQFQSIPGVSGGAILGDGSVGLILDVPNLLVVRDEKTREEEQATVAQMGRTQQVMIDSY